MNKFAKLAEVVEDLQTFLSKSPDERVQDIKERGLLPEAGSPDVLPTGKVRVIVAVDVESPLNNEAEFSLPVQLDEAIGKVLHENSWKVESWETWLHYLDGPAKDIVS